MNRFLPAARLVLKTISKKTHQELSRTYQELEEFLQGFWHDVVGDMIAGFFVQCYFLGEMQQRYTRDLVQI